MGYSCTIQSHKEITESEIQKIVDEIPNMLRGFQLPGVAIKQSWGWSLYADVKLPTENQLVISGSYSMSGNSSRLFINHFIDELKLRGHEITTEIS